MTPKFRVWLKEEKRMTDVHEMSFIDGEVYLISDVTGFYAYEEFKKWESQGPGLAQCEIAIYLLFGNWEEKWKND